MTTDLLEIQPRELKFTFELKKQSSCAIQLSNNSNHYVAFKVKTTSPKKYCVRPNTGIIKPKATCDFTVTMQAQSIAPPDLQCKDKFLIQSTVVHAGTTQEDITSKLFSKDCEKYIEEKKLRVVLMSPPSSPVLVPKNGESKQDPSYETSVQKDKVPSGVENIPPPHKAVKDFEGFEPTKDQDELRAANDMKPCLTTEDVEEAELTKDGLFLNLTKDFKELTSKLNIVDSKLKEAELTIMKLTEEKSKNTQGKEMLKHELEILKRKNGMRNVQVGFPLLYVFMVALIGLVAGYLIHP
ncbi:Vesicle-associated membrane-protein-associated protein [Parasponia andersonii]|uniref:Vesicle-associated membrane-protein-associated protein n=1 Tax=Parasponia andersonii TaxID=3476 RepID=A0A2P5E415_PARAD|nr:Vesicle-associated membrane-protein-associated protein [Parasponia andersonii]